MSTEYFSKLCATAKLTIPAKDADVRKLLEEAGATVLDQKSAAATKLRMEHAAAILWARDNIDKDRAWSKLPDEARNTLLALFPIQQSVIDKGGSAWVAPCRALIRAYSAAKETPKKRKGSHQISKGPSSDESGEDSSSGSANEKSPPPNPKKPAHSSGKGGSGSKEGAKVSLAPYLPTQNLLAVLPTHRRAQLHLADTWSTKTKAERAKQMDRIMAKSEYGGRFEDPDTPAWSQRISLRRGSGSAYSDDEINQDGRNLVHIMRWDSAQLLFSKQDYEGLHRMHMRAERVGTAWTRFLDCGKAKVAPASAILTSIFRAVLEVLDQRLTSATGELCDAGAAGEEILGDMARQKQEVKDLFSEYDQFIASMFAGSALEYTVAARRANSIWYGLLQPVVAYITQDTGTSARDDLEAQAEAAFNAPSDGSPTHPPKRPQAGEEIILTLVPEPPQPAPSTSLTPSLLSQLEA
jgi:hypothetical protein